MVAECAACPGVEARHRAGLEPAPRAPVATVTDPGARYLYPSQLRGKRIAANVGTQMREMATKRRAALEAAAAETEKPEEETETMARKIGSTHACAKCGRVFARAAWRDKHQEFCTAMAEKREALAAGAAAATADAPDLIGKLVAKRLALLKQAADIERALEAITKVARGVL